MPTPPVPPSTLPCDEHRPVEVLHEGRWVPGTLLRAYRTGGRWRAVVRYATAPGERYQQARWAEDVRPAREE
ncbi:hypothetical protein EV189_1399 [Motilibacter rhizosphaerae]|uniref:Agenet domain-containing protein n=1 Tax=Motilibacter rhizosphaerae TaxID=598652 RepID=A0A4Q7NS11_9ACTN|nr:hypothetical protein [Motilibacter rhizosphaerae]RZS89630.1 hypothetical protein EV189_1399 [Motilibacter rhizosphaerae]